MTTNAERETLPSASTLISGMTKLLSRGDDAAHELGSIRATLLVNFGEAAKVNRYGLAIKDEGSTHDILMAVLKHLASPIASAKADNELRCFVCHREMTRCTCGKGEMLPCDICRKPACAVQCGNCCHILCPDCEPGNHLDEGCRQLWPTPAATSDVLPQEPAGRELPDGPGFWQRYGEKWVIRQHTESMFFGCHCDANGYLGRTIAVLPKGGWRRADAYARDAAQHHAEACRRLIRLRELLAKTLALAVDMDANYILEPPATTEILALLTWEEPNDATTLLAWAANSDCASWDQSRSQFIHGNGVDPVEVLQSEFDTDGLPILDDKLRAALIAAKGGKR